MKKRENMLRVRFSDDEFSQLQALADRSGFTMSELVRDHIGRMNISHKADDRERLILLNRLNANLNMIARWVNTHKSAASAVEVVSHLMAIERHIRELTR
ncbi:plasmid mobilization protein [Dickeya undicola]|uniref:plasmid mobilization protein n=1 Tax=Dickeya undicola TaxID=1577887 RepID=UPI00067CD379|nr:plasmid mobilization relaxosome protein MobC [Dickeya undicola]